MGIKVSEMNTTELVNAGDWFMVVQEGENKKIDASRFQMKDEPARMALSLNGYTADDFLKIGQTAYDSDKLGGLDSNEWATKEYVDSRTGGGGGGGTIDPTWCMPRLWFDSRNLPQDGREWAYCDGRQLIVDEYPDLFNAIGYNFTWYVDVMTNNWAKVDHGDIFSLPDLRGRFILGANTGTLKKTSRLPNGIYSGPDFDEAGQFVFPSHVGLYGGDPLTTQESVTQMASHGHYFKRQERSKYKCDGGSNGYRITDELETAFTEETGYNNVEKARYPNYLSTGNKGMLSMPPYTAFAWIMLLRP